MAQNINATFEKSNRLVFYLLLLFGIIIFIAFYPAIYNNFTDWDDASYLFESGLVNNLNFNHLKKIFTSYHSNAYKPLLFLSFSFDYTIAGFNPAYFHITNIFMHIVNFLLVYYLIFLISGNKITAALTAGLFAVHPLRVESVVWIVERKDLMYSLFLLSSIISYFFFHLKNKKRYFLYSIILFIFSLAVKPQGITLPAALIVIDYLVLKKKLNFRLIVEKIPYLIICGIFLAVNLTPLRNGSNEFQMHSLEKSIFIFFHNLSFYLIKLVYPVKLSAIYPEIYKSISAGNPLFWEYPALIIFITLIIIFFFKKSKEVILSFILFIIFILPALHVITIGRVSLADRYTYFSSIFFFFCAAKIFFYFINNFRQSVFIIIPISIFIGIFTIYSYLSYTRCYVWQNSLTLWQDTISKYPDSNYAYFGLGNYYLKKNPEYAIQLYKKSIELDPAFFAPFQNMGIAYYNKQQYEKCVEYIDKALLLDPYNSDCYYTKALAYYKLNNTEETLKNINNAIYLSHIPIYYRFRGSFLFKSGMYGAALSDYNTLIKMDPLDFESIHNGGLALEKLNLLENALVYYNQALSIAPVYVRSLLHRAIVLRKIKKFNEALNNLNKIESLAIDNKNELYYQRALLYFDMKKSEYARNEINKIPIEIILKKQEYNKLYYQLKLQK